MNNIPVIANVLLLLGISFLVFCTIFELQDKAMVHYDDYIRKIKSFTVLWMKSYKALSPAVIFLCGIIKILSYLAICASYIILAIEYYNGFYQIAMLSAIILAVFALCILDLFISESAVRKIRCFSECNNNSIYKTKKVTSLLLTIFISMFAFLALPGI